MTNKFTHDQFLKTALEYAVYWTKNNTDVAEGFEPEAYVVWSCKTLQNSKALISTTNPDGMYYEATLNGDSDAIYFDAYMKVENKTLTWTGSGL